MTRYEAIVAAVQRTVDAADAACDVARVDFDFGDPVAVAVLDAHTRAHATLTVVESARARHDGN